VLTGFGIPPLGQRQMHLIKRHPKPGVSCLGLSDSESYILNPSLCRFIVIALEIKKALHTFQRQIYDFNSLFMAVVLAKPSLATRRNTFNLLSMKIYDLNHSPRRVQ